MTWNFLNILIVVTTFQLLFFAAYLLTRSSRYRMRYLLLALFLLSMAFPLLSFILYRASLPVYLAYPFLFWLGNSFAFFWGPSLFFYVQSLVCRDFAFKKADVLHTVPFALYWLYKATYFLLGGADVKLELLIVGKVLDSTDLLVVGLPLHALVLGYAVASIRTMTFYGAALREAYSSVEKIDLSWLRAVVIGFGLVWLVALGNSILSYRRGFPALIFCNVNMLSIFCISNLILFKGLRQNEAFSGIERRAKYERSTLDRAEAEPLLARLRAYMQEERPHLRPSLSVDELGQKMHVQPRHLSQVINELAQQSFIDFVNGYRIEEARRLLKDPSQKGKNVLDIVYEVGFNSKAAFNSAFKRRTGMTPSEFRKSSDS